MTVLSIRTLSTTILSTGVRSARVFSGVAAAVALLGAAGMAGAQTAATPPMPPLPPYLANFTAAQGWSFEPKLTSALPGDVFVPSKEALEKNSQFPQVQRLFDLWSWQAFLAVNWPTSNGGQPASSIAGYDAGNIPAWSTWHESTSIYLPHGATPPACATQTGVATATLATTRNLAGFVRAGVPAPPAAAAAKTGRALFNVSAVGELINGHAPVTPSKSSHISEVDQAFTGPLFDQNGNPTFYEILLDNHEVGYLCANKLYSIAGQIDFSTDPNNKVQFPAGQWQTNGSGAFELKLAWRILDPKKDKADRFFHQPAQVLIDGAWTPVEVGLVGMHIAHKSQSSPQWIWSTFEQVDNLATDQVANPGLNPSYFNPNCPTCLVNVQPVGANPANHPTQALRMIPIPPDKQELNREAQAALHAQNSVWQYYQLIDTQWPTNPSALPISPGDTNLPESIDNKSGGNPTPVYLTNITMETYFQVGNQSATLQQEGNPKSTVQVFGTESCTGCHSSAGIAKSGTPQNPAYSGQLTADFSWLMQIKAQ
jgi:hypothetical protein